VFSGIIDAVGRVRACEGAPSGKTLVIQAADYWDDAALGASIAIDGVCLTITGIDGDAAAFDVVAETLRRTTLGTLRPSDNVNLQKSMSVGQRVDGHFVQGHVDATATVVRTERCAAEALWWFEPDRTAMTCIIPKGSVAVDGISLTVAAVRGGRFSVALIPTTLDRTTLGRKREGSRVNVETDILVRTVVHCLQSIGASAADRAEGLTPDSLRRSGFA